MPQGVGVPDSFVAAAYSSSPCLVSACRTLALPRLTAMDQLGFHNLPFLAHRKSVKKGFEFSLMVVGKRDVSFVLARVCMRPARE